MNPYVVVIGLVVAVAASLLFSILTYALRDLSRGRLGEVLERRGRHDAAGRVMDAATDMAFAAATLRLLSNSIVLVLLLALFHEIGHRLLLQYIEAVAAAGAITLLSSVALPHAIARHAGEQAVVSTLPLLWILRRIFAPVTRLAHAIDGLVRRAAGINEHTQEDELEQEILSIVEEGEKEGVVDDRERRMIESVIQFHDTTAAQIMTARPEIVGLDAAANLQEIIEVIEQSGHSRLPVYQGTLDHVVGILYARDLLKHVGKPGESFDIKSTMRPPLYVPETKPLRDLLQDFRLQKVHLAIVLDEYGGTAGLVTIEDTLEELVGEISDEHEPTEPAMFKRHSDTAAEVDARIYIDEINRLLGLEIPDDAGFDTLGGFITNTLGRIPQNGSTFELLGARYSILDAEPQKINRVRIELLPVTRQ